MDPGTLSASVTEMLNELGWRSLEERLIDARLVLMYKIVQGLVPVSCSNLLRPALRRSRNTHEHSFLPIVCNTSSHYLSFFPRTINQWNSIPSNIFTNCNTTDTFRQRISLLPHSSNVQCVIATLSRAWGSRALFGGLIVNNAHVSREIPISLGDCTYVAIGHSGGAPDLGSGPLQVFLQFFYYLTFHYLNFKQFIIINFFFGLATCIFC